MTYGLGLFLAVFCSRMANVWPVDYLESIVAGFAGRCDFSFFFVSCCKCVDGGFISFLFCVVFCFCLFFVFGLVQVCFSVPLSFGLLFV